MLEPSPEDLIDKEDEKLSESNAGNDGIQDDNTEIGNNDSKFFFYFFKFFLFTIFFLDDVSEDRENENNEEDQKFFIFLFTFRHLTPFLK